MRKSFRIVLGMAALCAGIAAAAESSPQDVAKPDAQRAAGAPRQLLQPPKMSVPSPITDRLALRGLFYMPSVSTDVRYDSSLAVPGTLMDAEDVLGLADKKKQGDLELMFRMLERHRIRAEFYRLSRSGDRVLDQQIRFGDDVYNVGDRVLSKMDLRTLDLVYTYSFLRREKLELSGGLGIHLLQAEGQLDVPARFVHEHLDTAGPFPTLAFDGTWRFTKRFSLNGRANYLGGETGDVKASYLAWHADVQFRWRPNFALGAGYTLTHFYLDSRDPDESGFFRFHYQGPEAFVRVSF